MTRIGVGRLTGIADRIREGGAQQLVTIGVPAVDGCLRDPGGLGHRLDGDGAGPAGAEQFEAGGQDAHVGIRASWPASPRQGIGARLGCVYHLACSFEMGSDGPPCGVSYRYKLRVA